MARPSITINNLFYFFTVSASSRCERDGGRSSNGRIHDGFSSHVRLHIQRSASSFSNTVEVIKVTIVAKREEKKAQPKKLWESIVNHIF